MFINSIITGRLIAVPKVMRNNLDQAFASAKLIVERGFNRPPQFVNVTASGDLMEALMEHEKGDIISVEGSAHSTAWPGRDGTIHSAINLCVRSFLE